MILPMKKLTLLVLDSEKKSGVKNAAELRRGAY